MRTAWMLALLLCCALPGRAQEPAAVPASAPASAAPAVPDFSAGFKQLAALGMPPLDAKATWSVVPEAANSSTLYELRELAKSVKGNAWLLPSTDGKARALAFGGTEVIELKAAKKRATEPDLTKDAEAIIAALKKRAAQMDGEPRDPFGGSSYRSSDNNTGSILLFATQLYQTGHPDLANRLALAIFNVFPSREAAVDAAVHQVADPIYQKATREFFISGDWAAYQKSLADLTKRFPRGWSSRDAVAIFLPQLEKQAAGTKAPVPTLTDIPIDPRALAIIRELTDKPPPDPNKPNTGKPTRGLSPAMRYRMEMGEGYEGEGSSVAPLWLLAEADKSNKAETDGSVSARLAALKMAALPALAALASDPFLTHLPNPNSYYSSRYYSSDEGGDERILAIYASLNRPATRGEIATRLLTATLPDSTENSSQPDPEAIREAALAFWNEHHNATREELAAVFLRDGSNNQATQAAIVLAGSTDPKAHQAFEAHVLAADPAIAKFGEVRIYLRARKAAARPFFDAYAKLVRSQTQDGASNNDPYNRYEYEIREAGGPLKILKQLEALIGGQTPRALAVQIAKGKPANAEAAIKSLSTLLEDATPTKHLHALLEGANAATDASIRARFLKATFSIRWGAERAQEEGGGEAQADESPKEDASPAVRKVSDPEANVWRKLVADTRELPKEFSRHLDGEKLTVSNLAALAFESSVSNFDNYSTYAASTILNKPYSTILIEQGTARLAGKPVAPLPDASKISADRVAEIVATAGKKPSAEIHPYLSSLTPDERAAWFEWLRDPEDLAIPDSVKDLQFTIVARDTTMRAGATDVKGAGNLDIGFKVTADNLTKHIAALAPDIDQHSRTSIRIYTAGFGPGLEISASVVPLPSKKPKSTPNQEDNEDLEESFDLAGRFSSAINVFEANEAASAIATVYLESEYARSQSLWLIQDGKATLQAPTKEDGNAEEDNLAGAFKALLESKQPGRFQLMVQFLTRADAEKFKAAEEDSEPSDDSPPTDKDEEDESSPEDDEPSPPLPTLPP